MPEVDEGIAAGGDDGNYSTYYSGWFGNLNYVFTGYFSPVSRNYGGWRFQAISVPQGAKLDQATLTVWAPEGAVTGTTQGWIFGHDVDDAGAWSNANHPANMAKTTARTQLQGGGTPLHLDVTAIVQEIVDRAGWSSGNDLAFGAGVTGADGRLSYIAAYDNNPSLAGSVEIIWRVPARASGMLSVF